LILQDFGGGLSGMKRTLLVLFASVALASAQEDPGASAPAPVAKSAFAGGEGVNGEVLALAVQLDGKVVIGGRFSAVNGQPRNNIARLNPDGTLDPTFAATVQAGVNGQINALALPPSGGILVGGAFTEVGTVQALNLGRYNADGTADKTFGHQPGQEAGANGPVFALAVQPDGKVVVGGNFSTVLGQPRRGVARLNTDNSLDGPIAGQTGLNGAVRALAGTTDDGFVAGGTFQVQNQTARNLFLQAPPAD
jgi:uncharacterized delta-60 repeat protein